MATIIDSNGTPTSESSALSVIDVTLDIRQNRMVSVLLKQYNKQSQQIKFTVTDNGEKIELKEIEHTVLFKMMTPDGRRISSYCAINENDHTAVLTVAKNYCSYPGKGTAELEVMNALEESQIGTMNLDVIIENSVYPDEMINGSSAYQGLDEKINAVRETCNSAIAVKEETEAIRDECDGIRNTCNDLKEEAQQYKNEAMSYANGESGTRYGEETDNAKYFYEQSLEAKTSIENLLSDEKINAENIANYATLAENSKNDAENFASNAAESALEAVQSATQTSSDKEAITALVAEVNNKIGSPLTASTISEMTNQNKIYVYTGSEDGYTFGNWYYYDGSAWTSGGIYNSTAFETDSELIYAGQAADAKETGLRIDSLKEDIDNLDRLKSDLKNIILIQNSAWDDSKEKPTSVPINGYTRSELLYYNQSAKLYDEHKRYYEAIFFDDNKNKIGVTYNTLNNSFNNAKYIAFTWSGETTQTDVYYCSDFEEATKNRIAKLETFQAETISGIRNLKLTFNSIWDDGENIPIIIDGINNYTRTDLLLYNEDALIIGTNKNYEAIFYDENKQKLGYKYNSIKSDWENTKYIAIFWSSIINTKVFYDDNYTWNSLIEHINNQNNPHNIPVATINNNGLMTSEDKLKLLNTHTEISISGSGVTKNASAFGFLPTNDAETNNRNLQNCLNGGGTILIDLQGVYDISNTLFLDSDTTIIFGAGVYIRKTKAGYPSVFPRHLFVNRGALTRTYNENISLYGLKVIIGDTTGAAYDIEPISVGLRGLVSFFYIKNLVIDGFELVDYEYPDYAIQICTFERVICRNIHIEIAKDGVHYGRGRDFVLENCTFLTDDDPIALNAVDFPASNAEIGNIEDGIIRNITFLSATGKPFHQKRGMLIYVGAWKDWESGGTYRKYGDCVVSNGRMYKSVGELGTSTGISTVAPNHTSGTQTYSDGFTWLMKQENDICYSATVRNITFENMYIYRKCTDIFWISSTISEYYRPIYPESVIRPVENITFKNVNVLGEASNNMFYIDTPIDNIKLENCKFDSLSNLFMKIGKVDGVPMGNTINMAMIGNIYNFDVPFAWFDSDDENVPKIKLSACGSMVKDGFSLSFHRVNKEVLNSDISVN